MRATQQVTLALEFISANTEAIPLSAYTAGAQALPALPVVAPLNVPPM